MPHTKDVLVACGTYPPAWGGLEIMALEHIKQLKNQNFNLSLLTSSNSELKKKASEENFNVLPILSKKNKIKSINKLRKFLKKTNIKIIHTHYSHDLWIIVPALLLAGSKTKLYLTKHMASGIPKKDIFHKFLYNRVNRIFAVSNFIKQNIL
ncbi:MAG TPA: glycosyltransferase family 4 protein, partial [Ignavibacteria bacterium]